MDIQADRRDRRTSTRPLRLVKRAIDVNGKQRAVLTAATLAAALAGLFPPWQRVEKFQFSRQLEEITEPAGVAFLLTPPVAGSPKRYGGVTTMRVDADRLAIEWATLAFVALALMWRLADSRAKDRAQAGK